MPEKVDVAVIGGGQAGLATSYELTRSGTDHVVLERDRIGSAWRNRWDSFCLVLPNWALRLPGHSYTGDDPDGFMPRDEVVAFLEGYASASDAPVRVGVGVAGLRQEDSGWMIRTSDGALRAKAVVIATGAFQRLFRPPALDGLPDSILEVDLDRYQAPDALPPGKVLIIGSGQSGCQIAEDLVDAGRDVFMACGRSPWLPRRIGDRDMYWWATESGFMDMTVEALPDPKLRLLANPQVTGRNGGHDLNFRTLHEAGVTLLGRFLGVEAHHASFAPDLSDSIAFGDQALRQFGNFVRQLAERQAMPAVDFPEPSKWDVSSPSTLDLHGFGAVVNTSGYRPDYRWMDLPEVLDPIGFPIQDADGNGPLPGLHFVGVHFLRKRQSSLLPGVGEDAAVVVKTVTDTLRR